MRNSKQEIEPSKSKKKQVINIFIENVNKIL